jgi:hypothetical protein
MKRRIAEGMAPLSPKKRTAEYKLIGKADEVADACPNKAGIAAFSFQQCKSSAIGDEPYCTCYANTLVEAYMLKPNANMLNINKLGTFALQECDRQGISRRSSD